MEAATIKVETTEIAKNEWSSAWISSRIWSLGNIIGNTFLSAIVYTDVNQIMISPINHIHESGIGN